MLTACASDVLEEAEERIGPEGGELTLSDGFRLEVGPGALSEPTRITVKKLRGTAELRAGSHRYELGPSGLQFDVPAKVDIPFAVGEDEGTSFDRMRMFVSDERNTQSVRPLAGGLLIRSEELVGGYLQGEVRHFSTYWCGEPWLQTSTCFEPIRPGELGCTEGRVDGSFTWGITEWGDLGTVDGDGQCRLPKTEVGFTVNAPEVWLLRSWVVEGTNVSSADAGIRDLTTPTRAFVPNAPGYDYEAVTRGLIDPQSGNYPFFSWWSFSVWPDDPTKDWSYSFVLEVFNIETGETKRIVGDYGRGYAETACVACRASDEGGPSDISPRCSKIPPGGESAGDESTGGPTDPTIEPTTGGSTGGCTPRAPLSGEATDGQYTEVPVLSEPPFPVAPAWLVTESTCNLLTACDDTNRASFTLNLDTTTWSATQNLGTETVTFDWGFEDDGTCSAVYEERDINGTLFNVHQLWVDRTSAPTGMFANYELQRAVMFVDATTGEIVNVQIPSFTEAVNFMYSAQ